MNFDDLALHALLGANDDATLGTLPFGVIGPPGLPAFLGPLHHRKLASSFAAPGGTIWGQRRLRVG